MLSACAQHTITSSPVSGNTGTTTGDINTKGMAQNILYYINEHRKSVGLPELQMINEASAEATKHSIEMANGTTGFGHEGFDARIDNITKKIGSVHASAENVAYGHISAKEVVDMWISSAGHKKNMEGNYTLTGIGTAQDNNGTIYFTEIFLRK